MSKSETENLAKAPGLSMAELSILEMHAPETTGLDVPDIYQKSVSDTIEAGIELPDDISAPNSKEDTYFPDTNESYYDIESMVRLLQQAEAVISQLQVNTEACNNLIAQANELADSCSSLQLNLVKAQSDLVSSTGNCQNAINQVNSSLKDAATAYNQLAEDFDATVRKSMLDVVDGGSKQLLENLARNYKSLHFHVEQWNRSGALGGLYFVKYGFAVTAFLQFVTLAMLTLFIYRLK